jgi:hypothetical protein
MDAKGREVEIHSFVRIMNQRQTLTEYTRKQIQHHLDHSGEGITAFAHRLGMTSSRIRGFLLGASSLRLDTADKILKAIEK